MISQETYDDVIRENILEFSMTVEESRNETIQQFKAQSVNLSNLILDLTINETTGKYYPNLVSFLNNFHNSFHLQLRSARYKRND